jgi:CRISPR-associated protein Csm5
MKTDLHREIFACRLKILSPLHLGCDAEYEPMGFCVDEAGRRLIAFDPHRFIAGLSPEDKAEFSQICQKGTAGSILELYHFLRGRQTEGRRIKVCRGFIEHYKQTLGLDIHNEGDLKQEFSNFAISRTAFTPHNQQPYIPGTAIKGALRTAYLNGVASVKQERFSVGKGKYAGVDLERKLLNAYSFKKNWKTKKERKIYSIENDPFRFVKISDFMPLRDVQTKIVYAVNKKKTPSENKDDGLFQLLEVIEPGAEFHGQITIETKHRQSPVKWKVKGNELLGLVNQFYSQEFQHELKKFKWIRNIPDFIDVDNIRALMRLGRHSGAECVTIKQYREINSTTHWLASDERKPVNKKSASFRMGGVARRRGGAEARARS